MKLAFYASRILNILDITFQRFSTFSNSEINISVVPWSSFLVFKVILCTYFYFLLSSCKLRLYNLKSWIVVNMKRCFMSVMFIHQQFHFRNYFFTRADFSFDWFFFIKSIWWNRTRPIFSKSDQTDFIKQKY